MRHIILQLKRERDRLDRAIAALENGSTTSAGRPRRRRHMSPEGRRRISEMMKKRWAERRKKKGRAT